MDKAAPGKIAVALSGGGIRSATFSLGVLQALAGRGLLGRIHTLSTVSGGGYIGTFLCRLAAEIKALDEAVTADEAWRRTGQVLLAPTSAEVKLEPSGNPVFHPLQWLRENSRYLTPSGSDDLANGLAYYLRGLVGLHFNLAVMLLLLGLANVGLGSLGDRWNAPGATVRQWLAQHASISSETSWVPSGWWLAVACAFTAALSIGVAYWLTSRRTRAAEDKSEAGRSEELESRMGWVAAAALLATFIGWFAVTFDSSPVQSALAAFLAAVCLLGAVITMVARAGIGAANKAESELERDQIRTDVQRRRLTWLLTCALKLMAAAAIIAAIDTLAMSLVQHRAAHGSWLPLVAVPAAVYGTVIAAAWKWLNQAEPIDGKPPRFPGLAQLALLLLALAVIAGLALIYQVAAYKLAFGGTHLASLSLRDPLPADWLPGAVVAAGLLSVAICVHYTPGFLNLSSFHNLYAARLKRAYLGAANPGRLKAMSLKADDGKRSKAFVKQVVAGDEPATIGDYLAANAVLGIEHIVNVTVNQRISPTSPTLAQDRQGLAACLAQQGMLVNLPQGDDGLTKSADRRRFDLKALKESSLSLGQWISISGAAFSVGVGKETKPGYALLSFLANVRTAYWWRVPDASPAKNREGTWHYLLEEARCRFKGLPGRYWYLSDGGHFDNTAVYELLRRKEPVILASDNGADPCYRFDDLMHLLRRARIDFGAEAVLRNAAEIARFHSGLEGFGTPDEFRRARQAGTTMPHALWVEVYYDRADGPRPRDTSAREMPDTVVIFIKPALAAALPGDVAHYAGTHPAFPQETTADQFFDEAQWESYRALGQELASRVLRQDVFAAATARLVQAGLSQRRG